MSTDKQQNYWGELTWKARLPIALFNLGLRACCRSDGTINRRLAAFLEFRTPPSQKPINGVKTSDVIIDPDPSRNLWFRIFIPGEDHASDDDQLPVIIYFHGGGFMFMHSDSMACDRYCRRLAKEIHCVVVSVNYRLTPEHKYPSQYEDGFDALKFIDNNKNLFECANLKQCFIAGDSAGGNLAHFVTLRASESSRNFHSLKVIGLIALQPFFGGEERTESELRLLKAPMISTEGTDRLWKAFLPEGANRDHAAVNVFGPNGYDIAKVEEFPATLVFAGGFDPLHDWQIRYCEGLKKAGKEVYLVEYPNMFHAFYSFPELKESGLLIEEASGFIKKQVAKVLTESFIDR